MHMLFIVLVLLAAAVLWWYRRKMIKEAANDAADALERARGSVRRGRPQKLDEKSPLAAIDHPVVAAATLMVSIVSDGLPLAPQREKALRKEISGIAAEGKAKEAVAYAKWAAGKVGDTAVVIDTLTPLFNERLDETEKNDLLTMIRRVATAGGPPLPMLEPRMRRLRQKLGVVVH